MPLPFYDFLIRETSEAQCEDDMKSENMSALRQSQYALTGQSPSLIQVFCAVTTVFTQAAAQAETADSAPGLSADNIRFNDSHLHLTNYVQEGPAMSDYVDMLGDTVGRSTVFGLPLQQMWSYGNTGDYAPDLLFADRRPAVPLLIHRRADRDGLQGAYAATAGAAGPHDYRL